MVGAIASVDRDLIGASSATPFCPGTVALYTRGAIAAVVGTVAFLRGGIPVFVRPVVIFTELHHSANKRYLGTRSGRALRWVQHEERRGR